MRIASESMAFQGSLRMKTSPEASIAEDLKVLGTATRNLGAHAATMVQASFGTGGLLRWLATIAAIYLLALDRTNWRTKILTTLLIPYIFLNLPSLIFGILRGQIGMWIAFIAVVLRLFFPRHFPDWLELPGALILLLVCAPNLLAEDLRASVIGVIISLGVGLYLLQQHIRAAGSFRNAFAEKHGVSNTIGILLLFVSPLWELITFL